MTTEMKKNEYKTLTLQQKDHIATLMERLDSEKRFSEKLCGEKYDMEKERDKALAEILSDNALERLQDEAFKAGRAKGYEDAETEFQPYEKQRELDALRDELAELKENKFPCDVYWGATCGDITLYKIPNEIGCLNTLSGDNAVLEAFQNGFFGEEWGSYSSLSVVEMTREELADLGGLVERKSEEAKSECSECGVVGTWLVDAIAKNEQLCSDCADAEDEENDEPPCEFCGEKVTERDCPCLENVTDEAYEAHLEKMKVEEPETPKSTKDLAIDQLNEEPHDAPAFEPLHEDATHQVVRGHFSVEFVWKVPAGINLRDTDTYEFGDKWGILYIENMKTSEKWTIEEKDEEEDFKRAHDLEVEDRDDDDNAV